MKAMMGCGLVALILIAIVGGVLVWGVGINNGLVRNQVAVDAGWSQVENVYQRRADLIPNLVETVKGAANFEKGTLQAVIDARARATQMVVSPEVLNDPAKFRQFQQVQGELSGALSRLMAVAEAYPDLKANQNFLELQRSLSETEDRIAASRRFYNANVRTFNTKVQSVPSNLIANMFGFKIADYFEVDDPNVRSAPRVQF